MFEKVFKEILNKLVQELELTAELWRDLRSRYSESGRFYHTLSHLDSIISELNAVKNSVQDWETMVFSVAYHDSVYDPLGSDNEERSADLAETIMKKLSLPEQKINKCREQILATKKHGRSDDKDTNYFTDADLNILGSSPEVYMEYAALIREEYRSFPDAKYNPARIKILSELLEMPAIYKSKEFFNKFEAQARLNMRSEIEWLSR
jgi:predicted metal-dependent HD superfamily phosphohydrolase